MIYFCIISVNVVFMHTEKVLIGSNDVDSSLTLRVSSLFKIIQDVIMHQSEKINVGVSETIEKGILWVVSRVHIVLNRLPKYQEEVICETYPGKTKLGLIYPRFFKMKDKNGNTLISFSSIWSLMDKEKRKPTTSKVIEERCIPEERDDELSLPEKVEEIEASEILKRKVQYSDVDLNGHLNNTRYMEILSDIHDSDFYKTHQIKSLTLNYMKEIREGESISLLYGQSKTEYIEFKVNNNPVFRANIAYK